MYINSCNTIKNMISYVWCSKNLIKKGFQSVCILYKIPDTVGRHKNLLRLRHALQTYKISHGKLFNVQK